MQKSRQGRRSYRVETLAGKARVDKTTLGTVAPKDHALTRLRQRTKLPSKTVFEIRQKLKGLDLPAGTHHLPLQGGSAVIKDVGRVKKQHVLATVLGGKMSPPGRDLTMYFQKTSGLNPFDPVDQQNLLSEAFRRAYLRGKKVDLKDGLEASMPRDPEFLAALQKGEKPTTPFKDLAFGRRLPLSSGEGVETEDPMGRMLQQRMRRRLLG